MIMKGKDTTKEKSAGKRTVARGKSESSYTILDTCDKCTLRVYIDIICHDNLRALVVSGNPSDEVLEEAKIKLVTEFRQLSGDSNSKYSNSIKRMLAYKLQVVGLSSAIRMLASKDVRAFEYLRANGIPCNVKSYDNTTISRLITRIESKIRTLNIKIREEHGRLLNMPKGTTPTEESFNDQLVILSKHAGFRLTRDITLAEYAGYLKNFKHSIDEKH